MDVIPPMRSKHGLSGSPRFTCLSQMG